MGRTNGTDSIQRTAFRQPRRENERIRRRLSSINRNRNRQSWKSASPNRSVES